MKYSELDGLSFKEILGYCIRGEKRAKMFYRESSDGLGGLVAEKFEKLGDLEEEHEKELLRIYKKTYGDENYPTPDVSTPYEGCGEKDRPRNLIDALRKAMEWEDSAYRMYKHLMKNREKNVELFEHFALEEGSHYETLRAEKSLLEKGRGSQSSAKPRTDITLGK